jgi:hypothetical protein
MSSTKQILRCQHIKVDGVQCGSPALRDHRRCFFHDRWERIDPMHRRPHSALGDGVLPALEDANSIQLALAEVMRLAIMGHIEYRVFSLLLSALRIAAANVKHMSPAPKPTNIVIDPESVENRPLGATAWSETEGKDYDMIDTTEIPQKSATHRAPKPEKAASKRSAELAASFDSFARSFESAAPHPDPLDKPCEGENHEDARHENDRPADDPSAPPRETVMIPWNQWNQASDDAIREQESTLTP